MGRWAHTLCTALECGEDVGATVQAIAATLLHDIWNGDHGNPLFSNYIDGTNTKYSNSDVVRGPWENGTIYSGWQCLAKHNADVATMLESVNRFINNNPKGPAARNAVCQGILSISGASACARSAR